MTDIIQIEKNRAILDILSNVKSEFNISSQDIISLLTSSEKSALPIEVFAERKLSVLQAAVKFLRENLDYTNKQASELLNKDPRSVWDAYKKSKSRVKPKFAIISTQASIPLSIFKNNPSLLESLVFFLKKTGWQNRKIAEVLNRSETTISTIYGRVSRKNV